MKCQCCGMFRRITEYFYIAKVTSIVHVQKSVKSIGTKCDAWWKFHFGILSFRLYMYFTWNINTPCTLSAQPVAKNRIRCHKTRHLTRIYTVCIDFTATSVVIQNSQKRNHKPCTPNMMQKTHHLCINKRVSWASKTWIVWEYQISLIHENLNIHFNAGDKFTNE